MYPTQLSPLIQIKPWALWGKQKTPSIRIDNHGSMFSHLPNAIPKDFFK